MRPLSVALVHHPVLDGRGEVVTSALTNLDVHDLARSAKTYGCVNYFVTHPIDVQRQLARRIVEHWTTGSSSRRIPDRKDALSIVRTVGSLDEALADVGDADIWATAAREVGTTLAWSAARAEANGPGKPIVLVFGTSWGLAPDVLARATHVLAPIRGGTSFNHLSVRAACAIALDRLRGT